MIALTKNGRYIKTDDGIISSFDIFKNQWFNFNEMIETIKTYTKDTLETYLEYFEEIEGFTPSDDDSIKVYAYLQGE